MTTKKTHMVLTTGKKSVDSQAALESRAARFGIVSNTNSGSSSGTTPVSSKPLDPAEADKLAKRAARFSDIKMTPSSGSKAVTPLANNPEDAEKLAKRAARFADIPK